MRDVSQENVLHLSRDLGPFLDIKDLALCLEQLIDSGLQYFP